MPEPPRFCTSRKSVPAETYSSIWSSWLAGDWPSLVRSTCPCESISVRRVVPPGAWSCAISRPSVVGLIWKKTTSFAESVPVLGVPSAIGIATAARGSAEGAESRVRSSNKHTRGRHRRRSRPQFTSLRAEPFLRVLRAGRSSIGESSLLTATNAEVRQRADDAADPVRAGVLASVEAGSGPPQQARGHPLRRVLLTVCGCSRSGRLDGPQATAERAQGRIRFQHPAEE